MTLTPYAATKIVNEALAQAELAPIVPQMLYNYTTARLNKGKAPIIAYTLETGVDMDSLLEWVSKYITKKTVGSATLKVTVEVVTEDVTEDVDAAVEALVEAEGNL